jgi:hypothetical protein
LDTFQEPFLIYAEDDLADILENINEDTLIKVTVKLMFGLETFSVTTDEGKIKREIPRMGLKLIKKLQ